MSATKKDGCRWTGVDRWDQFIPFIHVRAMYIHNLIQHFQYRIGLRPAAAPKKDGKRHVLETLCHKLFTCAAILGRTGRNPQGHCL